jgi:adenylate cyclase
MTERGDGIAGGEWIADLGNLSVLDRLRRFVPAPVAEAVLSNRMDEILAPRQQEVVVVFWDLRGFTSCVDRTQPDEVARVLRGYHRLVGEAVRAYGGTLERFTGDGTMVFFSDTAPLRNSAYRAVRMALSLRAGFVDLDKEWRVRGHSLGLGAGVSEGYATAGIIGFGGRWDYGVIGPVTNLAARLCQAARSGEILVCPRIAGELRTQIETERLSEVRLKGLLRKVEVFRI